MSTLSETNAANITVARRKRLLELLNEFVQAQVAEGVQPKGIEQAFAAKLQLSPSRLSQIKKVRPIGDTLARQIERLCQKPVGWLDAAASPPEAMDEKKFLKLAARAWQRADAVQRERLVALCKSLGA